MNIIKRNRQVEEFTFDKIKKAIAAAFAGLNELVSKNEIQAICDVVSQHIQGKDGSISKVVFTQIISLIYTRRN